MDSQFTHGCAKLGPERIETGVADPKPSHGGEEGGGGELSLINTRMASTGPQRPGASQLQIIDFCFV